MSMQHPSTLAGSTSPWQQKQLSYGLKLLITFGAALLLIVALISGFILLVIVPQMNFAGLGPNDAVGSVISLAGVFAVSLFGSIKLFPLVSAPTRFKPGYGMIPAEVAGHPFEVKYQRRGWGRSLRGPGTVSFNADGLLVEGYLTPNPLLQAAIVIVILEVALILLYAWGIRLNQIAILIITKLSLIGIFVHYYARRKEIAEPIAYTAVSDLSVKGCKVAFAIPGGQPGKASFYVAPSDGERLYGELQERFPASMAGVPR
jgi:hypothetical protein